MEAKALALKFSKVLFVEIITSDLLRAYETAQEIHSHNTSTCTFQSSSLLKERSLGVDVGKSHEYFSKLNSIADRNKCVLNGESINNVFYRAQSVLNDLIKKYVNESYALDYVFKENKDDDMREMSYDDFTSEYNKGSYSRTTNNDNDHIDFDSMPKIALVSHCVLIKEFLNNILLLKDNKLINWIQVYNTAFFKFTIFCSDCKGKCHHPSIHIPKISIDIINDYSHLTNTTMYD